jgi:hypothetical protein
MHGMMYDERHASAWRNLNKVNCLEYNFPSLRTRVIILKAFQLLTTG